MSNICRVHWTCTVELEDGYTPEELALQAAETARAITPEAIHVLTVELPEGGLWRVDLTTRRARPA